jgi:putative solute:sodium symporter small subunit
MADDDLRQAYWSRMRRLALMAVCTLLIIAALAPVFAPLLNDYRFMRFPLGFFLVTHVAVAALVIAVYWFLAAQEKIERRHNMTVQY